MDDGAINADPITHRRKVGGAGRLMAETSADFCPAIRVAGNSVQTALFFHNARVLQLTRVISLCFEKRTPPQTFRVKTRRPPLEKRLSCGFYWVGWVR